MDQSSVEHQLYDLEQKIAAQSAEISRLQKAIATLSAAYGEHDRGLDAMMEILQQLPDAVAKAFQLAELSQMTAERNAMPNAFNRK